MIDRVDEQRACSDGTEITKSTKEGLSRVISSICIGARKCQPGTVVEKSPQPFLGNQHARAPPLKGMYNNVCSMGDNMMSQTSVLLQGCSLLGRCREGWRWIELLECCSEEGYRLLRKTGHESKRVKIPYM